MDCLPVPVPLPSLATHTCLHVETECAHSRIPRGLIALSKMLQTLPTLTSPFPASTAEAAVANLARLKPGMLLRPYDPEEDEPRSFELHGFCHPNSLPLLLDGITTALQRAGPGKGFPQMDAIKLDFVKISEGTVSGLFSEAQEAIDTVW